MYYREKGTSSFFAVVVILTLVIFTPVLAPGQDYPKKPINFVIPFNAGGSTDLTSRVLIECSKKYLEQPIIPINKGGAGGTIGTMAIITAKPDGYTIGAAAPSPGYAAPFSGENPYSDLSGLSFIMNYGDYIYPICVKGDAPWKTWKELVQWAKKNPGGVTVGLMGNVKTVIHGSVFRQIELQEGIKFTYIPYKGGDVTPALLGGHITLTGTSAEATTVSLIETGKLRVLIYLSDKRIPGFENAPTSVELYGIGIPLLLGIWGPKGIPEPIMNRLDKAFSAGMKDPEFINTMKKLYMPIVYMGHNEMTKYVLANFSKTRDALKRLAEEERKAKK